MRVRVRFTWRAWNSALTRLEGAPDEIWFTAGIARSKGRVDFVIAAIENPRIDGVGRVRVLSEPTDPASVECPIADVPIAMVFVRNGIAVGGTYVDDNGLRQRLEEIIVVAPGMAIAGRRARPRPMRSSDLLLQVQGELRHSRTAGAIGLRAWRRLAGLRIAIIGVGRLGSEVAEMCAASGIRNLVLVDPDRVESHNLGEMASIAWVPDPMGRPKAVVVKEAIEVGYGAAAEAVTVSVLATEALDSVKFADVIVSAADSPEARMAVAAYGSLYCIPLIDLGCGVFSDRTEPFGARIGLDARIVLPDRCLLCAGGLSNTPNANAMRAPVLRRDAPSDFGTGRLGSLRSLNSIAAGIGMRWLEDLARGAAIPDAGWVRMTFGTGIPVLLQMEAAVPAGGCTACRNWAGAGDAGVRRSTEVLRGGPLGG